MAQLTIQQAVELAARFAREGRQGEAESIQRQLVASQPDSVDQLQIVARLAYQAGHLAFAEELLRRAIALEPGNVNHHSNLGMILAAQQKFDQAIETLRRAVSIAPKSPEAHGNLANALQSKGLTDEAIAEYQIAIGLRPDSPEFHNNLANSFRARGDLDAAIEHFRSALSFRPGNFETQTNLGLALKQKCRWEESIAAYRAALAIRPNDPEPLLNLGNALLDAKRADEAIEVYRSAIAVKPDLAEAHYGMANAFRLTGDLDQAVAAFNESIRHRPDFIDAYNNLGVTLQEKGELEQGIAVLTRASALAPRYVEARNNVGIIYHEAGRLAEAIEAYQGALTIKPDYPEAMANLALVLEEMGRTEEALEWYRKSLSLRPDQGITRNNYANVVRETGRLDEALAEYRRAAEAMTEPWAGSNVLFLLHTLPQIGPRELLEEHLKWARRYAEPLRPAAPTYQNDRSPERRIRIGFVSPDFNEHPVGRFLLPFMGYRNRETLEVYCYSNVRRPDDITEQFKRLSDVWRKVNGLSDERLAAMIRQDRIDILVDLTMHTKDNRLLVFARKPAPVQATYLAYPGTTGLSTIDYRLTDSYLDPPSTGSGEGVGADDSVYTEKSLRLQTYWCYVAPRQAPAPMPLPALKAGHVTFGCLNNFSKFSATAVGAWCELLKRTPASRLLLHSREGAHREQMRAQFQAGGVDPRRIDFVPRLPGPEYFQQYHRIDIALDPFPYPGGTTSCDALWMGVPVASLAGKTAVSRGGSSILSNVGLPQLVAHTVEQYVHIAAELASDLETLAKLRAGLREQMQASPLMDAPRFARDVEAVFRQMWRNWCATGQ
jgi:protein O-GlcNAc transferase